MASGPVRLVTPVVSLRERDTPLSVVMVCGSGPAALIGSERFAVHLARGLAACGVHTTLAIQTPASLDPQDVAGCVVSEAPSLDAAALTSTIAAPDVVVAVDLVWAGAGLVALDAARRWRVPVAVIPASAQDAWLDREASLTVAAQAQRVLVVTEAEGRALARRGVDAARLRVIGYGAYPTPRPSRLDTEYSLPADDYVLFLGRKRRDKGYRELLEAAPLVWARHPGTRFVFAGPRVDADCLQWFSRVPDARVIEMDRVSVPHKDALVAGCAVLCVPTVSDIFPQVFLEAWQAGKPVVTARFDGAGDVVRHGVDGVVVEQTAEAIANALVQLLDAPEQRAAMGRAGSERLATELSWGAVSARVAAELRTLSVHAGAPSDPV